MSEINLEGLTEEGLEEIRKEAAEKAKKEAEEAFEKAKKGLTEDLLAERQRRKAAEEEMERNRKSPEPASENDDPKEVFKKLLTEKEQEEAKLARERSLEKFRESVREFSKENDEAGIVFSKFENELKKFNLDGLKSEQDFMARYKDVYDYMNRKQSTPTPDSSFYQGSPKGPGSSAPEGDSDPLSDVEKKVLERLGWTKEKYLQQKAKHPDFVRSLLTIRS